MGSTSPAALEIAHRAVYGSEGVVRACARRRLRTKRSQQGPQQAVGLRAEPEPQKLAHASVASGGSSPCDRHAGLRNSTFGRLLETTSQATNALQGGVHPPAGQRRGTLRGSPLSASRLPSTPRPRASIAAVAQWQRVAGPETTNLHSGRSAEFLAEGCVRPRNASQGGAFRHPVKGGIPHVVRHIATDRNALHYTVPPFDFEPEYPAARGTPAGEVEPSRMRNPACSTARTHCRCCTCSLCVKWCLQCGPGPPAAVAGILQAFRLGGDRRAVDRCGALAWGSVFPTGRRGVACPRSTNTSHPDEPTQQMAQAVQFCLSQQTMWTSPGNDAEKTHMARRNTQIEDYIDLGTEIAPGTFDTWHWFGVASAWSPPMV